MEGTRRKANKCEEFEVVPIHNLVFGCLGVELQERSQSLEEIVQGRLETCVDDACSSVPNWREDVDVKSSVTVPPVEFPMQGALCAWKAAMARGIRI